MKIDTNLIPNFDALPEEAKNAISAMEFADAPDMSQFVSKATFDKKASEAADLNKKLRERMSEDERSKQEQAESLAAMQQELETLRKEKTVAKYTADYVKLGFDEKLAEETAAALAENDMAKVFANMSKANDALVKRTIADKLKETPRGVGGQAGGGGMTLEKLRKLSDAEYAKFASEHPEEYKALYSEKNE